MNFFAGRLFTMYIRFYIEQAQRRLNGPLVGLPGLAGAAGWRRLLAKSTSPCDTAGMATLSRSLRRWDLVRVAAASLGVAVVILLAGYAVAVANSQATPGGIVSVLALLAIVGSGLLYAWRLGAGGSVD